MSEALISVGLDVGTTSTQLIVSRLRIENRAGSFSVPEMDITEREILYKSPVHFTPLLDESHVDAAALRKLVDLEYDRAGIRREGVDTGAIIITGETSRKENARAVLGELSGYAGDFVVATAGPDLESALAAKGAGAVRFSKETGKTVLHMDIGGGTSNLALIRDGRIVKTGCLNVGGRLLKFDENGKVTYVSPVLQEICPLKVGDIAEIEQVEAVAEKLTEALEMAAGLREETPLLEALWTKEAKNVIARSEASWQSPLHSGVTGEIATPVCGLVRHDRNDSEGVVISFSGGVADCIEKSPNWLAFGDMGPVLGRVIRNSLLCAGEYVLGTETIRATVIGAGCHSAQLSGSTVYYRNVAFPMKNLPVLALENQQELCAAAAKWEEPTVLALPGTAAPRYADVLRLAQIIAEGVPAGPVLVCLEQDMAKALGQALAVRLGPDRPILCIDRVRLSGESYLDVGTPIGPALPVVVKTLVLER